MSKEPELGYEFGGFKLFPESKILLHGESRVFLTGRDFDLLRYLVIHNAGVVKSADLAATIWGEAGNAYIRNIAHRVSRIRKALGCSPTSPVFIKTFHQQKGYKFIAPVTERKSEVRPIHHEQDTRSTYQIRCHLFIPIFLGLSAQLAAGRRAEIGLEKIQYERGTVYLNSRGFGVWHLVETSGFDHLWKFANSRKQVYAEILRGKHPINSLTRTLIQRSARIDRSLPAFGEPGYVFSAVILENTTHRNQHLLNRMIELLATPSLLEVSALTSDEVAAANIRERRLLETSTATQNVTEFGLFDAEIGYASWDSVAYATSLGDGLEQRIVEFEVAVQILWWMCKCSTEILLGGDSKSVKEVRKWVPDIKRHTFIGLLRPLQMSFERTSRFSAKY